MPLPPYLLYLGELLLKQDTPNQETIESEFRTAINIAQEKQAKSLELRATVSLCKFLQTMGRKDEARKSLSGIYNWFTEGFDTEDLATAKSLLIALS